MDIKVNRSGTLQTAQLMSEKEYPLVISECVTRKMTPEDWERYGPLKPRTSNQMQKSKKF